VCHREHRRGSRQRKGNGGTLPPKGGERNIRRKGGRKGEKGEGPSPSDQKNHRLGGKEKGRTQKRRKEKKTGESFRWGKKKKEKEGV